MFDFKTMGALASLLQNKQKLVDAGQRIKQGLDDRPAVGEAGGGAVRISVDGSLKVRSVELSSALTAAGDDTTREQAERLIAEAVNQAMDLAKQRMAEAMRAEARELGIDDLPFDVSKLLGG